MIETYSNRSVYSFRFTENDWIMIPGLILISICAIIPVWINYDVISMDGAGHYYSIYKLISSGDYINRYGWGLPLPFYEYIVYVISSYSGLDFEMSARFLSAFSYIIGAVGIYKLGGLVSGDRKVALLAFVFFVANRKFLQNSSEVIKETLLMAFVIWGNFYIVRSKLKINMSFISGMVLLLCGAMLRSTAFIFIVSWIFIMLAGKKRNLLIFLIFILVALIYVWGGEYFRYSYNLLEYLKISGQYYNSPNDVLSVAADIIRNFFKRSQYLIGLFGLAGIYIFRKELYTKHLLAVLVLFFLSCILTGWNLSGRGSDRYFMVAIIYLIPCSAMTVAYAIKNKKGIVKWLAIITIIICPISWATKAFQKPDYGKLVAKEAGKWIMTNSGSNQDIITNNVRITYYADGYVMEIGEKQYADNFRKMSFYRKIDTEGYPLYEIVQINILKKIIAIDLTQPDGNSWTEFLKSKKLTPNIIIDNVAIYLPTGMKERNG